MSGNRTRPLAAWSFALACLVGAAAAQDPEEPQGTEDWASRLERAQQRMRRGELAAATNQLEELLDDLAEEPEAARPVGILQQAQLALWRIALRRGRYEQVRDEIAGAPVELQQLRDAVLLRATAHRRVGQYADAVKQLETLLARDENDLQARHELGEVLAADGQRSAARAHWQANAQRASEDPQQLASKGRSLYRLGGRDHLLAASQALVASLDRAKRLGRPHDWPQARTTLGLVYFAAYGESADFTSGEKFVKQVLDEHVDDEDALLAMYRIRSANMALEAGKTERFLERALDRNERCVPALVRRAANVLDDRRYRDAARLLDAALTIDPNDREALCHRAAAAWLLHDADEYARFRERALAGEPGWHECDRLLAEHLVALYRFADALPFFDAASRAAPDDVPTLQGMAKALIYTGEGKRARELLERCKQLAAGLNDPWRANAIMLQDKLDAQYVVVEHPAFTVQMHRDDAEVLQAYLLPVQLTAAEVLGAKYAWKPDRPTRLEVFQTWDDFSVRTIGFTGFTALGACFGRLITLVSPVDGDLRRQDFMWEATVWHEYAHVLTLGLSSHRVPRWLTEGFSVYEEKVRDAAWERGMDRDLYDAFHNQDIPPVHLLNRVFRGPRILFGYYQGGLIVEWIEKHHGFDKALALLRAFGEDLDTEEAFTQALGMAARDFDKQFLDWVAREKLRGMRLVKRPDDAAMHRLVVRANQDKTNAQARIDLAWGCLQRDNPVDAGRWLAEVLRVDPDNGQALLVRAELLRRRKDDEQALDAWKRGFAGAADDFDSRIAYGKALAAAGDLDGAIEQWQRAKACWPTCTDQQTSPELLLARLYRDRGEREQAQMEMKAFCRRTARAFQPRYTLSEFERDAGNRAEEVRYLVECNRIDPFHRELHVRLGDAYEHLGKPAAAALELEVAAAVTPAQDRRYTQRGATRPEADAPEELAERGTLWLRAAKLRRTLGDHERANALLDRIGRDAARTPAAEEAAELRREWTGK
jgi:tetratricopeptide (TPR) repeat protein